MSEQVDGEHVDGKRELNKGSDNCRERCGAGSDSAGKSASSFKQQDEEESQEDQFYDISDIIVLQFWRQEGSSSL